MQETVEALKAELQKVKAANRALQKSNARLRQSREQWIHGIELALAEVSDVVGDSNATPKNVARVIRALSVQKRFANTKRGEEWRHRS